MAMPPAQDMKFLITRQRHLSLDMTSYSGCKNSIPEPGCGWERKVRSLPATKRPQPPALAARVQEWEG